MKILSCNAGYFLGFRKPLPNYLLDLKRSCLGDQERERSCIECLEDVIEQEEPDVVALQEIDRGSIRTKTNGQAKYLEKELESDNFESFSSSKYGPSKIASKMPMLKKMSNGILSRHQHGIEKHYFGPGMKQLLIEYKSYRKDLSVFITHLPTIRYYRHKQLVKIRDKMEEKKRAILCGDFNCYHGKSEVEEVFRDTRFKVISPGETHPRSNPHRELNLFVVPKEIDVKSCRKIEAEISDHFPVVLEIE